MEEVLQRLLEAMKKEAAIVKALIDYGRLKQGYIIADNIKELDQLLPKEHMLLANLSRWEEERLSLQGKMGDYWQVKGEELTAAKFLERVKASFPFFYPQFAEVIGELTADLSFLQQLNRHNNELIEQSLQYIETVQAVLEGDRPGIYDEKSSQAQVNAFKRINLIDKKV